MAEAVDSTSLQHRLTASLAVPGHSAVPVVSGEQVLGVEKFEAEALRNENTHSTEHDKVIVT